MRRIGQYLTYANVMATIAVFIGLGGAAYAVSRIGPDDIKNNAIRSRHIKNGQVKPQDLARSIPAARVTRTASQTIPNNDVTAIAFNSERYDTAAMHSNTNKPSRLKAPIAGIYNITFAVEWGLFDPDGFRYIDLVRNGKTELAIDQEDPNNGGDQQVTTQARLRAGDFVQARAQQNSGGPLPIYKSTTHEYSPELSMTWLAPG